MPTNKINLPRLILAKLRGGDFAHAGDEEAIKLVMEKVTFFNSDNFSTTTPLALDIGSGLGGTANVIQNMGIFKVKGIDIDPAAISYAQQKYPNIEFKQGDANNINLQYPDIKFSLIYMFNVFYAIREQRDLISKLSLMACNNAVLAIFDYTLLTDEDDFVLKDLAGKEIFPIKSSFLKEWLKEYNWDLRQEIDLTENYIHWYKIFLNQLKSKRNDLVKEFTEEAYLKVGKTFESILNNLVHKKIGGGLYIASFKK